MLNKSLEWSFKMSKSDHATVLTKTFQQLSISLQEKAKVLTMAHKALQVLLNLLSEAFLNILPSISCSSYYSHTNVG